MLKITKDFDNPPAVLLSKGRLNKIQKAVDTQSAQHISNSDYSPELAKDALEALYHAKCSYCESTVLQVAALQVEHYRPKNGVLEAPDHKGYYWLAVEWSNLVLGCPNCNGQGAKGNKFPVLANRVLAQNPFETGQFSRANILANVSPLLDEAPLLLHPEIDDPKLHLKYDGFGLLKGKTKRGKGTIEICNLNRDALYAERQTIVNYILKQCNIIFLGKLTYNLANEVVDAFLIEQLKLLKAHWDDLKKPYTAFVGYVLENPTTCLYPSIEAAFKTDFKRAFAKFRRQELR